MKIFIPTSLIFVGLLFLTSASLRAQPPRAAGPLFVPAADPFAPTPAASDPFTPAPNSAPSADPFATLETRDPFGIPTVFEYAFTRDPFAVQPETAYSFVARGTKAIAFYATAASARPSFTAGSAWLAEQLARGTLSPVKIDCFLAFRDADQPTEQWEKLSAAEKLTAQLDRPVTMKFSQIVLESIRAQLEAQFKLPVLIDRHALDEAAYDSATPIDWYSPHPIKLRTALHRVLYNLSLTYITDDGVLTITTRTAAENHLIIRTYAIEPDLLKVRKRLVTSTESQSERVGLFNLRQGGLGGLGGGGPGFGRGSLPLHAKYKELDSLLELITSTIQPTTWKTNGGMGDIQPNLQLGLLVVSNTEQVHDELAALLDVMAKKLAERRPPPVSPDAVERIVHPVVLPAVRLKQQNPLDHDRPISKEPAFTMDELVMQIKKQVAPESWAKPEHTISSLGQNLIVTQTHANHVKIHALLQQLGITKEQVDDERQFAEEQEQTRKDIELRQNQERERLEQERVKRQAEEERQRVERAAAEERRRAEEQKRLQERREQSK